MAPKRFSQQQAQPSRERNSAEADQAYLFILRKAHHQLRLPKWQRVASINLPEMIRLAIQAYHFFHLLCFGHFPDGVGHVGIRHYKHTAADLQDFRLLLNIYYERLCLQNYRGQNTYLIVMRVP